MKALRFFSITYNRIFSLLALVALLATWMVFPVKASYIGVTERISVTQEGSEGNGDSWYPSISADGRFVAFDSSASNFSSADSGGSDKDVFVKDRVSGELFHVTSDTTVIAKNGGGPSISGDSQLVAFSRSDYISGDYYPSVLMYNRQTGDTVVVCQSVVFENCRNPSISADSRYTAFDSARHTLVPGDTNGKRDVFVFNNQTHQTVRASVASDGIQADGDSSDASISADGRYVAFESGATNLVAGDTNGDDDVFVHDTVTGQTVAVSLKQDGTLGKGSDPVISADGRFVAFFAWDFLTEDFNGYGDVYIHDRDFDEDGIFDEPGEVKTIVASIGYDGRLGNRTSSYYSPSSLSADGRFVAFYSEASNLVPIDTNSEGDIFVHDRDPDEDGVFDEFGETTTFRISVASNGGEANGVSLDPSISVDGAFVAFRSNATNLVDGDTNGRYDVFVREVGGIAYTVSGRVRDLDGIGIAGVTIAAGRMGSAITDSGGFYHLTLRQGAYDLVASKDDLSFSPPAQAVELTQDLAGVDFVGVPVSAPLVPFLDLPFNYGGNMAVFEQATRNHDVGGGWLNSWFDHQLPNYSENDGTGVLTYRQRFDQGLEIVQGGLYCYGGYCYDGHNALDFKHLASNESIRAAGNGTVAEVCQAPPCSRDPSYGKYVVINHSSGYATLYAHLNSIAGGINVGASVSQGQQVGTMGGTPNWPVHLHFGVYFDSNGDSQWTENEVVDPFGWRQAGVDPWVTAGGPVSVRLWQHWTGDERTFIGDESVLLQNTPGTIRSLIGAGTWDGQVTLELDPGPVASPSAQLRSIGRSFWEILLEFFGFGGGVSGQGVSAMDTDPFAPQLPITQTVTYSDQEVRHIDESQLTLYWWDEETGAWQQLPSTVDVNSNTVVATTLQLGQFDVQGPLVCPSDSTEIDDSYFAASQLVVGTLVTRWFDISDDEDWLRFNAELNQKYVISATNLAAGVSTNLEVYDLGGTEVLASDLDGGEASIQWTAPVTGTHFLRVSPAPGSQTGCGASYDVVVVESTMPPPTGAKIYLPLILK